MIHIFTTGGTFDKIYFDANSAYCVGEPQVAPIVSEARVTVEHKIESILKKDSLDMSDQDRKMIASKVDNCTSQQIIIIHGTDGMVASTKVLATKSLEGKVVVLLGAMQPARMRYTDAPFNLGFGMAAVQLLKPGIYIAMNGRIFPHDGVQKNLEAGCFEATDQDS